jgi:Papain family cysteine protease
MYGQDGLCQFYKSKVIAQISAAYYTNKYDEAMKTAVAQIGPISVALFANSNFMSYQLVSKFTGG